MPYTRTQKYLLPSPSLHHPDFFLSFFHGLVFFVQQGNTISEMTILDRLSHSDGKFRLV
jgi:hypothetical protein